MPLEILHTISPSTQVAVWNIQEELSYFTSKLSFQTNEEAQLSQLIEKRKLEKISTKYLFSLLLQDRSVVVKNDKTGKPYIEDRQLEISISHSRSHIAVMVSTAPCGLDIQYYTPKIEYISKRFLRSEEENLSLDMSRLQFLHLIWSSKEAVYKIYAERELNFLNNIQISKATANVPFDLTATVTTTSQIFTYSLKFFLHKTYILVYGQ